MLTTLHKVIVLSLLLMPSVGYPHEITSDNTLTLLKQELIFPKNTIPSSHASTLVENGGQIVAAWFGGTKEGNKDIQIWSSHFTGGKWTKPRVVASGYKENEPTWNPVLFNYNNVLYLFYKIGKTPTYWHGEYEKSHDGGKTWSTSRKFPEGFIGPAKNKPITIKNTMVFPSSTENDYEWCVHLEMTQNMKKFHKIEITKPKNVNVIQPTLLKYSERHIQMLTRSQQGVLMTSSSTDGGKTWSMLSPS